MISFADFTKRLAMGQLKNLATVDQPGQNEIDPDYIETILELTNQGLVDISTKFPLISRQIDILMSPGVNTYPLTSTAVGTYLDASQTEPFVDEDFVRVLELFSEDGRSHTADTNGHIMTPTYNTLRFTGSKMVELKGRARIRYQAKHAKISENDFIVLPPNLEPALQLFVASLYIAHMGSPEHKAIGDGYYAAYLRHIGEDETRNTSATSEVDLDTRFNERGFV